MESDLQAIARQLKRPASKLIVGGFRPPDDPFASWFGRVQIARTDEAWPLTRSGGSMQPLCQINCAELPHCPPVLTSITYLTLFVAQQELSYPFTNSEDGWVLRTYTVRDELVTIPEPRLDTIVQPFPIRYELFDDYPQHEDLPEILTNSDLFNDPDNGPDAEFREHFPHQWCSKIGGWPSHLQGRVFGYGGDVTFAFQIETEAKAQWMWRDRGIGYIGFDTRRQKWVLDCQYL